MRAYKSCRRFEGWKAHGFRVDCLDNVTAGLRLAGENGCDSFALDVMLPTRIGPAVEGEAVLAWV